jgi:3-hydroxyisobutyrate dehydrogenase-like beta-hydroxyacid dehydrogenase
MMTEENSPQVAILGLGIMGTALANNLENDGLLSATWNRSSKNDSPRFKTSISDAVSNSEFILILVTDDRAVSEVLKLIQPYLSSQHLVIQCSTVNPQSNIDFQQRIKNTGAHFIEALIGGSKGAAVSRKIIFYTGGEKDQVDRAETVLAKISAKVVYVGEVGKASAVKLAMNLNLAMQIEALCESFAYAEHAGINAETFFNVLKNNTAWCRLVDYKETNLRDKEFAPQFSVKNMLKDIRLALDTDRTDNGLTLLKAVEKIYASAESEGLGDDDMIALYKLLNS